MRIVLVHAHHHIDQDIVGALVTRDIPELHGQLASILAELDADRKQHRRSGRDHGRLDVHERWRS